MTPCQGRHGSDTLPSNSAHSYGRFGVTKNQRAVQLHRFLCVQNHCNLPSRRKLALQFAARTGLTRACRSARSGWLRGHRSSVCWASAATWRQRVAHGHARHRACRAHAQDRRMLAQPPLSGSARAMHFAAGHGRRLPGLQRRPRRYGLAVLAGPRALSLPLAFAARGSSLESRGSHVRDHRFAIGWSRQFGQRTRVEGSDARITGICTYRQELMHVSRMHSGQESNYPRFLLLKLLLLG